MVKRVQSVPQMTDISCRATAEPWNAPKHPSLAWYRSNGWRVSVMQYKKTAVALVTALALATAAASPASAAWRGHGGGGGWHGGGFHHGGGYHHGGGWRGAGIGAGIGFATGALVGSALAAPYYNGAYGYGGYGPYASDEGYDGAYAAAPEYSSGGGSDDAYCAQRYRSYDPGSGTFLGYDGARHPCP
jgi:hypothetical protein